MTRGTKKCGYDSTALKWRRKIDADVDTHMDTYVAEMERIDKERLNSVERVRYSHLPQRVQ